MEMDQSTSANTSQNLNDSETPQSLECEMKSVTSREICTNTDEILPTELDVNFSSPGTPATFDLGSSLSENLVTTAVNTSRTSMPLVIVNGPASLVMQSQKCLQPLINSDLPSPASVVAGQPQTLFLQALSKLNESSLSMAVMNHFRLTQPNTLGQAYFRKSTELSLSPPDSLTSAPPSYSFVLRQMAVRRRPRIVGTFIPSPSFVQHTPPPNYAAAFDVYVENPLPPPPTRVYNFGFASMPVVCPECGYTGMSVVTSKITICTHLCAIVLCVMCCWVCAPLPYVLRSCKDVYHYCRNCRNFLGMYCPTNPENALSS